MEDTDMSAAKAVLNALFAESDHNRSEKNEKYLESEERQEQALEGRIAALEKKIGDNTAGKQQLVSIVADKRDALNGLMDDMEAGFDPTKHSLEAADTSGSIPSIRSESATTLTPTRSNHASSQPGAYAMGGIGVVDLEEPVIDSAPDALPEEDAFMVTAQVVGEEEIEAEVRERIFREAVQAEVQPSNGDVHEPEAQDSETHEEQEEKPYRRNSFLIGAAVILLVIISIAVAVSVGTEESMKEEPLPTKTPIDPPREKPVREKPASNAMDTNVTKDDRNSTLDLVQQRDAVVCGAFLPSPGLVAWNNSTGRMEGLLADICRAIAMAALGDPNKVEFVAVGPFDRFSLLNDRVIDVVTEAATFTMQRDVRETNLQAGLSFSAPFYYSGLGFAGQQEYIECIDEFDVSNGLCRDVKLCVADGTTHLDIIREHVPAAQALVEETTDLCIERFIQGQANVVAGEPISLNEKRFVDAGYNETIVFTHNVLSREPLSLVTLDVDTEWSDMVNSVMDFLYAAEGLNLTQQDAKNALNWGQLPDSVELQTTDAKLANRILEAVSVAGHYGEIYDKHFEDQLPRGGLNQLNTDADTGLLYSFPLGYNLDKLDLSITPGPKIESTLERGKLLCGVRERPHFAELVNGTTWFGMDVELCKAIASALFRTDADTLEIVSIPGITLQDVVISGFKAVSSSEVDVFVGAPLTLSHKYRKWPVGCSLPYFYGDDEVLGLASNRDYTKFGDFVYWIIMALIYAEEQEITFTNATMMPVVNMFGDHLKQMLIDLVASVGNYGDIYRRTLESSGIPRSGRNQLNDLNSGLGPQQFSLPLSLPGAT